MLYITFPYLLCIMAKSVKSFKYHACIVRSMSEEIIITPKVDAIGRIMIPKHVRDALGIVPGDLTEIVVRKKAIAKAVV